MYLTDYHTHSYLSPDGYVPLAEMAQAAVDAGLSELCITDHCDLLTGHGQPVDSYPWAPAVRQFRETAPQFEGRLKLKLGIEFGSGHLDPAAAQAILSQPELDFVIGSVHNMSPDTGGLDFYYMEYSSRSDCDAALDNYFDSMDKLARTDFYDVLGHIIYPLRYMHGLGSMDPYYDRIYQLLATAARMGRGIEVNTYRGGTVAEWRPVLERWREVGGELVTVGSDAHRPEHVGLGVREACGLLRDEGFRYVTVYEKRKPRQIPLP